VIVADDATLGNLMIKAAEMGLVARSVSDSVRLEETMLLAIVQLVMVSVVGVVSVEWKERVEASVAWPCWKVVCESVIVEGSLLLMDR